MALRVFCNSCSCEPRKPTPRFCLTSCGHVFCEVCLQKGKKDECLICKTACQTLVLSKQVNPDIQALFMGVDVLCNKYSKEITQIDAMNDSKVNVLLIFSKLQDRLILEDIQQKDKQTSVNSLVNKHLEKHYTVFGYQSICNFNKMSNWHKPANCSA
ncbi:hypothetical protein BTVI_143802 [Pitangus sulphuratus]|nr:hypothetical protein BTVI_143802 [Pitangus sulphuratus]